MDFVQLLIALGVIAVLAIIAVPITFWIMLFFGDNDNLK